MKLCIVVGTVLLLVILIATECLALVEDTQDLVGNRDQHNPNHGQDINVAIPVQGRNLT